MGDSCDYDVLFDMDVCIKFPINLVIPIVVLNSRDIDVITKPGSNHTDRFLSNFIRGSTSKGPNEF